MLFFLVGGVAALVNILSRIALNLSMPYEMAIVVAYVCGMTTAYVLNKLFVFAPSGRAVHDEYLRFAIVNMVAWRRSGSSAWGLLSLSFLASGLPGTRRRSLTSSASHVPTVHELFRPPALFVR